MQIAFIISASALLLLIARAGALATDAEFEGWNNCEMDDDDFQLAPWVVTIRRISSSGQVVDFTGAVLDHWTIITKFARYIVAPGWDWRLCEGATYTVFTGRPGNSTSDEGLPVTRVTPAPWLHFEGLDQNDHGSWMAERYNLVLVHLRRPLVLSKTLRRVCIPSRAQARDLKGLVRDIGSGLMSGYNRRSATDSHLHLTLGIEFLDEELCLEWWKVITKAEPFGDRACGHNSPKGTLVNPGMDCIPMDGGTVLRVGNRTILLGFTNKFYRNKHSGRCDEGAWQFISILNENSTAWIRRGRECGPKQFACSDGVCILSRNLCNGVADCFGGGDEDERYCKPRNCCLLDTEFACGVYGPCIPREDGIGLCNGTVFCPNGEDEDSCPEKPTALTLGISIGVGVACLGCLIGLLLCVWRWRRRREYLANLTDFLTLGEGKGGDGGGAECGFPLNDIRRVRYDQTLEGTFPLLKLIGGGRYGAVYTTVVQLQNQDQTEAPAVVKINLGAGVEGVDSFISLVLELKMLLLLKELGGHDNIVALKGANTRHINTFRLEVAMEHCATGSLQEYLRENRHNFRATLGRNLNQLTEFVCTGPGEAVGGLGQLTTVDLVKFTMQIAQGMQFLSYNRIVHGDLATRNVVLDGGLNVKICDFGLSHQLFESAAIYTTTTRLDFCWQWAAPEVLTSHGRVYNLKSDVWSFGVTAWEIFTLGQVPWDAVVGGEKDLLVLLQEGVMLPRPEHFGSSDELHEILMSCWKLKPEERVSFQELVPRLSENYDRMCCTFYARAQVQDPSASFPIPLPHVARGLALEEAEEAEAGEGEINQAARAERYVKWEHAFDSNLENCTR